MEVVVLEDDTSKHKPDSELLLLCMERLGLNKEDVIYIGDAYSDLLASRNAGIDFAFAKWGSVESKDMSDSDYILEKVEDLLRILKCYNIIQGDDCYEDNRIYRCRNI